MRPVEVPGLEGPWTPGPALCCSGCWDNNKNVS